MNDLLHGLYVWFSDPVHQFEAAVVAVTISEALSLIPGIKANGIFQAVYYAIKWVAKARGVKTPEEQPKP